MEAVALIFAPHPDDAEIGMGGTIAAMVAAGVRVVVVDLTDGEPTPFGSLEVRARETAAASQVLGIRERRLLNLPNRALFDTVENRTQVAAVIREIRPTLIFSPYWEDLHPDHVQASALVDAARFYAKFVKSDLPYQPWFAPRQLYFFSTHLRVRFNPSVVFDISQQLEQKMAAIRAYESQFVHHPGNVARVQAIETEALYWGMQSGVRAAEPFVSREVVRLARPSTLFEG
jgi:bacillithiol biosynthesis deacetylase BshB1